ncbi:hypothetical protein [Xanthomonas translucens]|uniref:hypothetical protein n=1 Tax=Xanthomonas campestris pv. translucens TaxID=343 RepID=UPI000D2292E9|nr:hypothetical protein [Xanthomonas translucens]AVY65060.1 hypothetical protein NZ30_01305 [Xanthomonas translucens pv. undulosa]
MQRFPLLASVALLCQAIVGAACAADGALSGVAQVMTNQLGSLSRIQPRGASQLVTVYFRDDALRIQFKDASGTPYALILAKDAPTGWIVGQQGGAMPVPGMRWPLRFDPEHPCADLGIFADCRRSDSGLRAGRPAVQWRYRLVNPSGPGMTRQGTMWLDRETGLVLTYRSKTGLEQPQQWDIQRVEYGPQADALFQPPDLAH